MEQWLQNIDIVEISNREIRETKTSRRERHVKAAEKKTSQPNTDIIYVYKRFDVEKGCGGGCGRDVFKTSFFPNWNRGTWKCVGSIMKNSDVPLIYDIISNTEMMCCSGFEHCDNFRNSDVSKDTPNYSRDFGYNAKKISTRKMNYQDAIVLLAAKKH
jgi:hypothetical protein